MPTNKEIKDLIATLADTDVTELLVENKDGSKVRIRRGPVGPPTVTVSAPPPTYVPAAAPPAPAAAPAAAPEVDDAANGADYVTSPFVGTFYRSPSPESAPYADVGTRVTKGQVICIIEAMKIMNEIESELDGTVAEVLAENGAPVEFGQRLFRIQP